MGSATAGHVTLTSAYVKLPDKGNVIVARYRVFRDVAPGEQLQSDEPATLLAQRPALSKYNVFEVPRAMQYSGELVEVFGVPRKSATFPAITFVAAVCEVELRLVCTPTGIKPKTAIKQKAATPMARVSSTSEKPEALSRSGLLVPLAGRTYQKKS